MTFHAMDILEWVGAGIALLAVVFLVWSRYTTSLLGKDFWVWVPVIGKMAAWRKMTEGTGKDYVSGALIPAEAALYEYYKNGLPEISERELNRNKEYLKLAHQSGRKPLPWWMLLILFALTVAEAYGTGALIAPLVSRDITPDGALYIGAGIAFVLAVVTLFFTHGAGEDLFRNGLIGVVKDSFRQMGGFIVADAPSPVASIRSIDPGDDQSQDAANPSITRLAARIHVTSQGQAKKRKLNITAATTLILAAFVLSTWYRHYELDKNLDSQTVGYSSMAQGGGGQNFQNMFATPGNGSGAVPLPNTVAQAAQQSQAKAQKAIRTDQKDANNVGVILLGVIYLFTQFLGVVTGYKYGFFDENAKNAYHETGGYTSYESFLNHMVKPVSQRANMRMTQLRSLLGQANPNYTGRHEKFDFISRYIQDAQAIRPAAIDNVAASPVPEAAQAPAAVSPKPSSAMLNDIAREVLGIADPEERRRRLGELIQRHHLSAEQQEDLKMVIARLKASRKAQEVDPELLRLLED